MAAKASRGKLHRSTSTWTTSTFSVEDKFGSESAATKKVLAGRAPRGSSPSGHGRPPSSSLREFYAPCEPRAVTPRAILRLKCAWQESNPPANQAFSTLEDSTEDSTICSRAVAFEQLSVLELGLVGKNVRVRVRGHGEVALSDELTYAGPADAAQVHKRDAPMAQVMR